MAKVVSIEIGYLITRICEVDYKAKAPKVHKSFLVSTPEGTLADGEIHATDEFASIIKKGLSEHGVRSRQLVFAVTSTKIATRDVSIPYVKENRIDDVVAANAQEYFPVDLEQYQLAYNVLGTEGEGKEPTRYKLQVLAAPNSVLKGYFDLASKLKMDLTALDFAGNSVYQIVKDIVSKPGTDLIVKLEGHSTMVMAVRDGSIDFSRSLPYGVDDAINLIMDSAEWGVAADPIQAYELASTVDTTESASMQRALENLMAGINRIVEFYLSRNQDTEITNVYILGLGADILGIENLISRAINRDVYVLSEVLKNGIGKYFPTDAYNVFLTVTGASISPVNLKKEDDKKKLITKPGKEKSGNSTMAMGWLIFGLCVLSALALCALGYYDYSDARKVNKNLNNQKASLSPSVDTYNKYVLTLSEYDEAMGVYATTYSRNEELAAFIEELEMKLPTDVAVSSFTADANMVSITMKVSNKSEAASVMEQMRSFESLLPESVSTTALSVELDEADQPLAVEFTVIATYKPILNENEQTEEGEADEDI